MTWICTTAGLPIPTAFLSPTDVSNDAPGIPGLGQTRCVRADLLTSASMSRKVFQVAKFLAEVAVLE